MWAVIILILLCGVFPIVLCIAGAHSDRQRMQLLLKMQDANARMQEVLTNQPQIEYTSEIPLQITYETAGEAMLVCPVCGKDWRTCLFTPDYDG